MTLQCAAMTTGGYGIPLPPLCRWCNFFCRPVTLILSCTVLSHAALGVEWNLLNGNVILPDPLELTVRIPTDDDASMSTTVRLTHPQLVGTGSGGAVFILEESYSSQLPLKNHHHKNNVVLKVSWIGSRDSVRNECRILQSLEPYQIHAIERCWGEFPYPDDNDAAQQQQQRIMVLLSPYVSDSTSNIWDVQTKSNQIRAVQQLSETMIQLLARNVVTIDVQPLISKETGQVILIDFSEAQILSSSSSSMSPISSSSSTGTAYTFSDWTLLNNFVTEMMTLIPDEFRSVAEESIQKEVQRLESQEIFVSQEIKDILIHLDLLSTE